MIKYHYIIIQEDSMKHYQHDEVTEEALKTMKQRELKYAIVALAAFIVTIVAIIIVASVVPVEDQWAIGVTFLVGYLIWGTCAGLAVYCINNYRYFNTNGQKQGGGIVWVLLLVFGLFLLPLLVVFVCNKFLSLAELVLGVKFER